MKKVGIMSMQRIANYGSFLQAYALKKLIENLGHSVEFVDYHVDPTIIKDNTEYSNKYIRRIVKGFEAFTYRAPFSHKLKFIQYKQSFAKKYLPLLNITNTMNYTPELDCLVIGSDEVFNCIQKNSNVGYSLELFGKNNNAKRLISYAASFGNTTLEKLVKFEKKEEIGCLLNKFDVISVRDANSGEIVHNLIDREPLYHLDPVLIYGNKFYIDKPQDFLPSEKFLVLYAYSGRISKPEADWISQYAKRKKLKVYAIGGIQECADKFINCSPLDIFEYFKNAEEIITDTFHGSIFSIITHRKFAALVRKSKGNSYGNEEKLLDLLERLNLKDRIANDIQEVENINSTKIEYKRIEDFLEKQRDLTIDYLRNNI